MTLIGIGMLLGFGFLALRHFMARRFVWGTLASLGAMLGMASLAVDFARAGQAAEAAQTHASSTNPWAKDS